MFLIIESFKRTPENFNMEQALILQSDRTIDYQNIKI